RPIGGGRAVPPPRPLRLAPEWDPRYTRMVAVSAAAHMLVVAAFILVAPYARLRPVPMTAYTVDLTDSRVLGGRLPPGPLTGELGGLQKTPAPEPKGQPEAAAKAPEPPAAPPKPPEPEPPPKAAAKPASPAAATKPGDGRGKAGNPAGREDAPARDAYAAAAERWKSRGGGLAGSDTGSGPVGAGGEGKGGGGQLVGLDFLAYRQAIITTIKGQWTDVFARPGLLAKVRFEIPPDGGVGDGRPAA